MTTCPQCGGPKAPSRYYCSRTCVARASAPLAREANKRAAVERNAALFEDIEFLLSCGESPASILDRLDTNAVALSRRLHRHKRHDLAAHFEHLRTRRHPCADCGELCWEGSQRCYRCGMAARDTWRGGPSSKVAA